MSNAFIAFISPYEELRSMALQLITERGYPARVYFGDMEEGVAAARQALDDGAAIVVSRGGTAQRISAALGIDVLEVQPSVYSAFAYIHAHTAPEDRIAVVGFNSLITICRPVCDILRRQYAAFEILNAEGAAGVMDQVAAWNPDVVIGDVISVRLARERSCNFHLIESSRETLIESFEQAQLVFKNLLIHTLNAHKLSVVLNCTREGAVLLNGHGAVEEINQRGCDLLRLARDQIIGKPFAEFFPDEAVHAAIASATSLRSALTQVNGKQFLLDLVCSPADMAADSAVALFQRVEHIQQTETSIRRRLMSQGFYARYSFRDIIYASPVMRERVTMAEDYSKTECNIMIQGETGTGKELFAQSIHNAGPRAKGPFVAVNCAALPGTLLESELFGYAPGAFTGALRSGKTGLFELAHNGTLFLDEIAEMDVFLQARLLRALHAREIMRLGDSKITPVNVRVLAATNKNPQKAMQQGQLRSDLFFRLSVLDLTVPPLRERKGDITLLFKHYLTVYGKKYGMEPKEPSKRFLQALEACPWPGNVRELENVAEKYVTLQGLPLDALPMGEPALATEPDGQFHESLESVIGRHIRETLRRENGNIARTAAKLAVDRNTVKRWMAKNEDSL